MVNNLILMKLLILLYINWNSYLNKISLLNILLFSMVYISIIIGKHFFIRKYEKIFNIFEAIITIIMTIYYAPMAIVLLSVIIMEYLFYSLKKEMLALVVPLILLIVPMDIQIIVPSLIIVLFIFINMRTVYKNIVKFNILINTVEKQRKQINIIENKLKEEQSIREQFLYSTKLEEINTVIEDLNQKIGQTISNTLFQLEAIKIMVSQDIDGSKTILGRAIKSLKEGFDSIKNTLKNIKPTEGELGINRVRLLLEENIKNTGLRFKVTFDGDLEIISEWQWGFIMNTVNELSKNSIRYSKGDFINVDVSVLEQNIRLQVSDNGIGATNIIKGNGLLSIEEKLKEVDGRIILKDDNGFSVVIFIPLIKIAV